MAHGYRKGRPDIVADSRHPSFARLVLTAHDGACRIDRLAHVFQRALELHVDGFAACEFVEGFDHGRDAFRHASLRYHVDEIEHGRIDEEDEQCVQGHMRQALLGQIGYDAHGVGVFREPRDKQPVVSFANEAGEIVQVSRSREYRHFRQGIRAKHAFGRVAAPQNLAFLRKKHGPALLVIHPGGFAFVQGIRAVFAADELVADGQRDAFRRSVAERLRVLVDGDAYIKEKV